MMRRIQEIETLRFVVNGGRWGPDLLYQGSASLRIPNDSMPVNFLTELGINANEPSRLVGTIYMFLKLKLIWASRM